MGIEKYIFSDVYNFFLKYVNIPDIDEYWENCINDAKEITSKYKNYTLARRMVTDVLEQLEFKICGKPLGGKTYEEWEAYIGNYKELKPFSPKTYK